MLNLLAQAADSYGYDTSTSSGGAAAGGLVIILIYLAVAVLLIASMWKLFQKAGKPGWAAIVPFYNTWVMFEIAGKPGWWFILAFIPIVNIVVIVLAYIELAKRFGKSGGYAALLLLLPFIGFPILAFGDSRYRADPTDGQAAGGIQQPQGMAYGQGVSAGNVPSPQPIPGTQSQPEEQYRPTQPTPPAAPGGQPPLVQ